MPLAIIWSVLGLISLMVTAALSGTQSSAVIWNVVMVLGSLVIGIVVLYAGQAVIWAGHLFGQLLTSVLSGQPQFNDGKAEKQDQYYFTATHKLFLFMWVGGHLLVIAAIALR